MNDNSKNIKRRQILAENITAEQRAFGNASEYGEKTNYGKTGGNQIRAQDWFGSLEQFLDAYRNANCQNSPDENAILGRLQGLVRAFSVGHLPDPVRLAVQKDGNPRWPGEREDVAMAVYYVEAAKAGAIQNTAYNKFIREHFGVQAQTVRRWVLEKYSVCKGIAKPTPRVLEQEIKARGCRFRKFRSGRGEAPY